MKKLLIALALTVPLALPLAITGCKAASSTIPTQAVAPGYQSQQDQTLGQSLAAATGFRDSEVSNYNCDQTAQTASTCLSVAQKAAEKPYLNSLIDAVNMANAAYTAYHAGSQTLAQAQSAYNAAETAQTNLTASKGVK